MPGAWVGFVRPFQSFVPTVKEPDKDINTQTKGLYVLAVLVFYLVASKIPLYGIRASQMGDDPLQFYRVMLASNRGTLMELGISPLVTSSMIIQAFTGSGMMKFDRNNPDDCAMYAVLEKIAGMVVIFGQAFVYTVFSGVYGSVATLGAGNALLIITQLCISAFIVLLLDDFLQKGYGFGSAISLFITSNLCEIIFWQAFSFEVVETMTGPEYYGAFVNLIYVLASGSFSPGALKTAFFRSSLPNISNLLATAVVSLVVIHFQGYRVDIAIKHTRMRQGQHSSSYPIKLFYTSNMPIMLQSTLTNLVFMVSSIIYNSTGGAAWAAIVGKWVTTPNGRQVPIGGLVYYMTAPNSIADAATDPIHTFIYIAYMLISCTIFAQLWLTMSGSSAKDVAKNLQAQGMTVVGYRQTTMHVALNRYIPTAAGLGGLGVGALTVFADFMGAVGSGTGILLAVGFILNTIETIRQQEADQAGLGGFMLSGMFGK